MNRLTHASKSSPCPICDNTDWCYELSDSLWGCKRADIAPPGWRRTKKQDSEGHWLFAVDNGEESEWAAKKAEWDAKKEERAANQLSAQRQEFKTSLSASQRDPLIRTLSAELGLSRQHRQILLDRGLTLEQINHALFFSIEKYQKVSDRYPLNLPGVCLSKFGDRQLSGQGIAIVTFDHAGLATGWQIMAVPRVDGAKYTWAKGDKSSHLPIGKGELPIITVGIPTDITYVCEGILKPTIAAHRHEKYFIGASSGNFSSSPIQIAAALKQSHTVIIAIDGGDPINSARMAHWQRQAEFFGSLGKKVLFGWWGQYTKAIGDIDEISTDTPIVYIPWEKLEKFSQDRNLYNELSKLNIKPTTTINQRFLPKITVKPNTITFVDSPCATGKTEQLAPTIDEWSGKYPNGKVIDIVHLNSIKDGHQQRLNIPEYRVGFGQNDAAINGLSKLSICLDSLLRLQLENIPPNSLLILDEMEAILKHAAQGNTLGDKAASLQAHFTAIIDRILVTGGAVIGLEDSLTDLSVKGLLDLTGNRYEYELIKNEYQPFKWDVSIGGGNNGEYLAYMLGKLQAGEAIFAPSTSQNYGEALQRLVEKYIPNLVGKNYRIDAKTAPESQALLANPNQWLAARDIRLLIGSPTIQSGFNSSNEGQFDRVMARFTNLDTRVHNQMLHRDRSDVPRDIFITKKGAEVSNSKNAQKILRARQLIANQTSLATGHGRINNNRIGDVWNRLDAEFSARAALSSAYLEDYLRCDLAERGHKISPADWATGTDLTLAAELGIRFKEIRQEILVEENRIMFKADGHALSPVQALSILHSSGVPFEVRQQAKKTLHHHDLPGAELTEEFLMAAITEGRGAYLSQCKLGFFLDKPALAKFLDKERFSNQLAQPHIMYSKVPKLGQKIDLLTPIRSHLISLASGRDFRSDDPAVLAIQAFALAHTYLMWALFGLVIKPEEIRSDGKRNNTAFATASKILRKLGYEATEERKEGARGEQVKVYKVKTCEHKQTIHQALEQKYKNYLAGKGEFEPVSTIPNLDPLLGIVDTGCSGGENPPPLLIPPPPPPPPSPEVQQDDVLKAGDRVRFTGTYEEWGVEPETILTVAAVDDVWIKVLNDKRKPINLLLSDLAVLAA